MVVLFQQEYMCPGMNGPHHAAVLSKKTPRNAIRVDPAMVFFRPLRGFSENLQSADGLPAQF